MKKVLLHICCGVCAFASIEKLKAEGLCVEGLFFNPNIQPRDEYQKRIEAARIVADATKIKLTEAQYNVDEWLDVCSAYGHQTEGDRRCSLCYELRLRKAFEVCCDSGADYFTTTLTISPHKESLKVFEIGGKISKDRFLSVDFKKGAGFVKTIEAAKSLGLYRQNYCGCLYSKGNK